VKAAGKTRNVKADKRYADEECDATKAKLMQSAGFKKNLRNFKNLMLII
jgi:hypothetical protein